jgi:hypothetical protein
MNINEDFIFRDDLGGQTTPIEIIIEPYKGVVYNYTKATIQEKDNNEATMKFYYNILESNGHKNLETDPKFHTFIGLIFNTLILEIINTKEETIQEDIGDQDIL